jgi:dephospho-CoA kinase
MLRVALTGGIATGKSYVRDRLAARGLPTIDSDAVVHRLLGAGTPVAARVAGRFGAGVIRPGGAVDRAVLGRVVFGDAAARRDLEAIVHPAVFAEIEAWFASLRRSHVPCAVADIPLLYETHREGDFDRVVVVACEPELQLRRVMERDGAPEAAARARVAAQWPIGEKVERADRVIRTDGSFAETDRQVDDLIADLDRDPGATGD